TNPPLKLNSQFGYDSTQIGIVWIALIIPQVVGGIAGGYLYDAFGLKRTFCMFLLAVPGPDHVAWICCVLVVTGLSFGIGLAPVSPGIAASIPQEYHTMGYSLSSIVFAIGICVGPVVGSFVYQSVGWMWQTVLFGCVMVVSTMIAFLLPDPRTTKDECTNVGE
ncbi:MFS general substrate transporter, partial [Rhizoclosmatium globosum]